MEPSQSRGAWKWVVGGIVVLAIIWVGYSRMSSSPTTSDKETIKIGVIAPITGPLSIFGSSLVNALTLAQEDLKNTKYKYEIIIEDDETNSAKSASAAQKLVNVDHVRAMILATSGTGQAAKPIATAAHVPFICVACTDITVADGQYAFTNGVLPDDEGAAIVGEATKRGVKTIALLTQIHPGIDAAVGGIKRALASSTIQTVYAERFDGKNGDYKTIAAKAQASHASLYFLRSTSPSLEILAEELKQRGVKEIAGGGGAFAIGANPSLFEGNWYEDGALVDAAFLARFNAKFPEIRFNALTAPHGYDSFMLFVKATEAGQDIATYLQSLPSYDGLAGHIEKVPGTGNFRSQPAIWTIKDGKPALLAQ